MQSQEALKTEKARGGVSQRNAVEEEAGTQSTGGTQPLSVAVKTKERDPGQGLQVGARWGE